MINTTNPHNLWSVESVDGNSQLCYMQIFDHAQSGLPTLQPCMYKKTSCWIWGALQLRGFSLSSRLVRPALKCVPAHQHMSQFCLDLTRTRSLYFKKGLWQLLWWPRGSPRWLHGKESTCQWRRLRFNPWVGKIPWRRKWPPTPVFLPGKSHGQRSVMGYSSWGRKRVTHDLATEHAHWLSRDEDSTLPLQGARVQSLERELRSHVQCSEG